MNKVQTQYSLQILIVNIFGKIVVLQIEEKKKNNRK